MDVDLSQYIQDTSPFMPEIDLGLLDSIIRDLSLEQGYYVGEAIVKGLRIIPSEKAIRALSRKSDIRSAKPEDLSQYFQGFDRALSLLSVGYAGSTDEHGLNNARRMIISVYQDNNIRDFLLNNLILAVNCLKIDISGIGLINQIVEKELSETSSLYYRIGLEAARRIFINYSEILDTLITSNPAIEGKSSSLFFRLLEYEKVAPAFPRPLPKKASELEKTLAALLEKPSCGTALLSFLRHPLLIPKLISNMARFIFSTIKNPDATEKEMSKTVSALKPLQKTISEGWQTGQVISKAGPELATVEERLSKIVPTPPYPGNKFVKDVQHIRKLKQPLDDDSNVSGELLEEWDRLGNQAGLEGYSALWTAIHIAFGDYAKQQFILTGEKEKQFIRAARRAYSSPLGQSTLFRAELGTRCICASRLGALYYKYGNYFELSAVELAQGVHDAYKDALASNERLYQRSPYKFSREKLLDRSALAVARIIEACLYLSERDKIKATDWLREAILVAENGTSRMLRGEMALAKQIPPFEIPSQLGDDENKYLERSRKIYATTLAERRFEFPNESSAPGVDEADNPRRELESIWTRMEEFGDAARTYVSMRRDEGIQWNQIQSVTEKLGDKFAAVFIYWLPDSAFLSLMRVGWKAPKGFIVPLLPEDVQKALYTCQMHISTEWQTLGEKLFSPLQSHIADVEYIYFFPHGPFNLLPLHAMTINGEPLIQHWAVVYAPSLSVLEAVLSHQKTVGKTLIMGYASFSNPDQKIADEMILQEADELAAHFQTQPISPELCSAETLKELSNSAQLIHLACHGTFIEEDPLDSCIYLADAPFTARDWIGLRLQADLVTLSSCESGVSEIHPGGDPVGLMRAILFAGASSLLTTLWKVNSLSTLDWMLKFYQNTWNQDGVQIADKAIAFRKATLELMQKEEYHDPYYWAPFILVGNYQ